MKRKKLNRQLIMALSVGMSAGMALAPVTALAEDGLPASEGAIEGDSEEVTKAASFGESAVKAIEDASDALIRSGNEENLDSALVSTEKEEYYVAEKITKESADDYDAAEVALADAASDVKIAAIAVNKAQEENKKVEDYNNVLDESINASVEVTDSIASGVAIKDGIVKVDEFAADKDGNTVDDATKANTTYVEATGKADEAAGAYDAVISDAAGYVDGGVLEDESGELLAKIKEDAAKADATLEEAKELVKEADANLEKAQTEYDEADLALADATREYTEAKDAYAALVEPESGATQKQIDAAKKALDDSQVDFETAKEALAAARKTAVGEYEKYSSAKYEELLALKNEMDNAEEGDAKETATKAYEEALIRYYFAEKYQLNEVGAEGEVTFRAEQVELKKMSFEDAYKLWSGGIGLNNRIIKDGQYVSGYEMNPETGKKEPVYSDLPEDIYVVIIDDEKYFFMITSLPEGTGAEDAGTITGIREQTFIATSGNAYDYIDIPAHYEKDGKIVDVPEGTYKINGAAGKTLVATDMVYDGYWTDDESNYVSKGNMKYTLINTRTDVKYVTDIPDGVDIKSGILVEKYNTYKREWYNSTGEYTYTEDWKKSDWDCYVGTSTRIIYDDWKAASARKEELLSRARDDLKYEVDLIPAGDGSTGKYLIWYTMTKYDKREIYAWKEIDPWQALVSKELYDYDIYNYVEKKTSTELVGMYYDLHYAPSGYFEHIEDFDNDWSEKKALYEEAKAVFDTTDEAYKRAQDALDKAKAEVAKLEAAKAAKKDIVDAKKALEDAKKAVAKAEEDKAKAKAALDAAQGAKINAEKAIAYAETKKTEAHEAVDKADKAKKEKDEATAKVPETSYEPASTEEATGTSTPATVSTDSLVVSSPVASTDTSVAATPSARAAAASSGGTVLGAVKKEATVNTETSQDTPAEVKEQTTMAETKKDTPKQEEKKNEPASIADEETAKAATPVLKEKSFSWLWLLIILAAIAGVSVEEYARRRKAKNRIQDQKADE